MTQRDELEIINRIRGEISSNQEPTGENLFLAWGYPTAIVLFIEFLALIIWNQFWCLWLWMGIPLIGAPLMIHFLHKDYDHTGRRTHDQSVILLMWIFIGFASFIGGTAMGFAGVFPQCYCAYQGLLIGLGCFMTGIILHFRPKIFCGIIASLLSAVPLFFKGELWPWQLLIASLIAVIALIIPGHLFRHYVAKFKIKN
ncbi:MAG: hypothetical protein IJR69_04675 [Bacteroidaceae bacterium]|nr:hypothetical protein [Bacteroidaceae bacterium]